MLMSLDQRVALSPDVVYRALGSEGVVLNLATGIYFGLNDTGTRIWELALDHPLGEVCAQLVREYDGGHDTIVQEVLQLVGELLEKGLLVTADLERASPPTS